MKIGYARVSTQDQELTLQLDALKEAGCSEIYQEKITGARRERPELQKLLDHLREGDVIVIWKLDRLARSLKDLVELVNQIQEKGAALLSLNDQIDTTTPHGNSPFTSSQHWQNSSVILSGNAPKQGWPRPVLVAEREVGQRDYPRKPNTPRSSLRGSILKET